MRWWREKVYPIIEDKITDGRVAHALRAELLQHATGSVVEIGFGAAQNVPHYPSTIDRLVGIEPNPGMRERAQRRLAECKVPVEVLDGRAEALQLDAGFADTAVSTLTLCSVGDPARTLAELRRVLRPGGQLLFLEHGLSEDPGEQRWQRWLTPVQRTVAAGCTLDRDVRAMVAGAGFRIEHVRTLYFPKVPRVLGFITVGRARPA